MKWLTLVFVFLVSFVHAQRSQVILPNKAFRPSHTRDLQLQQQLIDQPLYTKLNPMEQELYYWTNYARLNPKALWDSLFVPLLVVYPSLKGSYANSLKETLYNAQPQPFLKLNETLIKVARTHANDNAQNPDAPTHTARDGESFEQRIKNAGIRYCAGENISMGHADVLLDLLLLYLDKDLPSLGHRKTLMNPNFTTIGIGYAKANKKDQWVAVQEFACTQ
ncbi:MAG TPA: hypothetical protein DIW54_14355 [Chitinophagaceae bacterium]|nr:hypothetical protein [Chitinophagaceae bacterium]HCT24435.1 hypothetical protein [Chitinophagaceae bacterium]